MRHSTCVSQALAWAVALQAGSLAAQSMVEEDELSMAFGDRSTISIVTGRPQPLRRAPAVATVITAADMAAMGAVDLDEALEAVPGMHVSRSVQAYAPQYLIRGIHSDFNAQTLVLQNGVPMTTLFFGNRGNVWYGQPVENIARLEVIRGPGSALYGADAYAGVINIVTKTAAETPGIELGARAGSFRSRDGWMQYGGKLGELDVAAYLRVGRTEGWRRTVAADAQTLLDSLFGTRASLAPGPVNTFYDALDGSLDLARGKLRLRAGYKLRDNGGVGPGVASALDPVGRARTVRATTDLSWSDVEIAKHWRADFSASTLYHTQQFPQPLQLFPPGAFGGAFPNGMFGAPNLWERHVRLSAVATYAGFIHHQLRLGAGHDDLDLYRTQELKNFSFISSGPFAGLPTPTPGAAVIEFPVADSFLAPQRRRLSYFYAQDEWSFARDWTLTAGVRHDQFSDFGGTTNPRVALVWDARLDLTAKLLYGRAFRAPSFIELYSINNPVNRGNPNLRPETIETLEAALAWHARPDTRVNLSLFRYDMGQIIRLSEASLFNNTGSQRGRGAEVEVNWDASRAWRIAGHYALQRSIDTASGRDAGHAPHHHLFIRSDGRFAGGWLLGAQVNHVAGRRRAAGDARPAIRDYTTLDMTLRSGRSSLGWEVTASVRNLFNADVREPSLAPGLSIPNDLPMAPRSFYLQTMYRP
ncbi:TonB-dependent receptor [Aquincola sp. S2]|uniref:TonB-dependent receptor n=1 Tax=Pseudaquabacterium terrae TaxID=2732868 RepID=A0ABX2ENV9_9BURK|nr:TonB-dependent receptor [Aquabacterium terrae]NRF70313.1 TonB-dependent receptor [Aquabacterium terrae]